MRIADKMQYEQVRSNIGKNRSTMSELQNQAATQKRVNKPSDDPLAASRVLGNKTDLQGNTQFIKSLKYAKTFLEFTDQSLGDLSEVLMRAKELAIGQSNDASANEESRHAVATEIESLHNAMVNIGNRKMGDRFIFGGFRTQTAPFSDDGKYNGDTGEMNVHIDKENFVPMNVPGGRVFLGQGIDARGAVKPFPAQAKTIEDFQVQREKGKVEVNQDPDLEPAYTAPVETRGPASVNGMNLSQPADEQEASVGTDLFRVMRDLEISLRTNDKRGVQETLNSLDQALSQVVLTRSQVGSRGMALDNLAGTLEKSKVEDLTQISSLEDSDVFNTVSEINKTQTTLQATLQTSGKLVQPSLLDFLR